MKLLPFLLLLYHITAAQDVRRIKADELERIMQHPDTALVVNLWATWCAPCIKELPWFEKQARALNDKPVKFIFLSLDLEDAYPENIRRFIAQRKIKSTVLWLDESNANTYAPLLDPRWEGSIPATIFLHQKKGYRKFVEGEMSEADLKNELQKMLE